MRNLAIFAAAWTTLAVACNKESAATPPAATALPGAPAAPPAPTEPGAAQGDPAAAPTGDKQYRAESSEVRIKAGATASARLIIKPAAGLHFNAEYPAKFAVTAAAYAKSTKDKLTSKDGDVKIDGDLGVLTIPLQGLAAGAGALQITGSFSVCSNEQCYILRDEKLALQVTVQ
ncbi:MAG: hypothetical protein FJ100_17235 [Deltaproteobacteria bacterium]|nr:hypothetical protein [Deltaproteobacteria bacterium]